MEKSSFERVVGNIREDVKKQILREKAEVFDNQVFEELKGKEREKTPEEIQIISFANEATNNIRQQYGLENFDIPPKNIHIINEESWPEGKNIAFYKPMFQAIAMREQPAKIVFMEKIFHEMLHFKSYNALQVTSTENPKLEGYRVGFSMQTRDGKKLYFTNLNEAVTEEMTKRFITKNLDNPLFSDEINQTGDIIKKYPRALTESGEPIFSEDTFYAEIEGKKSWGKAIGRLFGSQEKSKIIKTEAFVYKPERKILNKLIDEVFERNSEKFQDREEVFEVFAKGMMTGNILPVGRLIEKTFGIGTLRRIGELDNDIEGQEKFVDHICSLKDKKSSFPPFKDMKKIEKERTISDAEFLKEGADYEIDKDREKTLRLTKEQIERVKKEMDEDLEKKNN